MSIVELLFCESSSSFVPMTSSSGDNIVIFLALVGEHVSSEQFTIFPRVH